MGFKPKGNPDIKRLQTTLAGAQVKSKDSPLYQVTKDLIGLAQKSQDILGDKLSKSDKINLTVQVQDMLPPQYGGSYSDIYTPTLTPLINVSPITTVFPFQYSVVGTTVNVSGMIYLTAPAAGTIAGLRVSLPILSYFQFDYQCAGTAASPNLSGDVASIFGEVSERTAVMAWTPPTAGSRNMYLHFMYQLVPFSPAGSGGGGGGGGGGGEGAGCGVPPTVPFPDDSAVVEAYALAHPAELANSCVAQGGNNDFMNGVIAALQAVDPRYGGNGKRGNTSDPSQDAISYYYGAGAPTFGSHCVYVIDIISGHCGPDPSTAWINVTSPTTEGAWLPGPI